MSSTRSQDSTAGRAGTPVERLAPEELWAMARGAIGQQDLSTARGLLQALVKRQPRNVEALRTLAAVHSHLGDSPKVMAGLLRRAIGAAPKDASLQRDLGTVLLRAAEYEPARRALERATTLDPGHAPAWTALGQVYHRQRRTADARAACERALEANPRSGEAMSLLARLARAEKDLEGAERWARRAAEEGDDVRARMEAWHLLGSVHERQGRWDEAFEAHTRGNRVTLSLEDAKAQLRRSLMDGLEDHVREGAEAYYRRWSERRFDDGVGSPVFLVGFPRSGTTMTEQMLAAVEGVVTTDEQELTMPVSALLHRWFPQGPSYKTLEQLDSLSDERVSELRRAYWEAARRRLGDGLRGKLLVDKYPLRYQEVGYLNLLFPESRIIFVVRDPRDCCLSGYFQNFGVNAAMVRFLTLETAGELYAETVDFWLRIRGKTTLPSMEVRYEEMVSDLEPHARRLVEFIGRPWRDEVLAFHERAGRRAISTPSVEAVSERVNTRAVGKWAHYERHLGPLMERVERFLDVWGYER